MVAGWKLLDASAAQLVVAHAQASDDTHLEVAPSVWMLRSFGATFHDPHDRVQVDLHVAVEDGEPAVQQLTVTTSPNRRRGIDRELMQQVPVSELLRQACAAASYVDDGRRQVVTLRGGEQEQKAARRRRELSYEHLQRVADIYLAHQAQAPTQAVATKLHLARSTAAKHVMRAREAGLLPPTRKGRATNRED